jgi:hypothetical protein
VPVGNFGHDTAFTFQTADRFALDERAAFFFLGCAPPKKPGASFYFFGAKDANAASLEGGKTYHLHVPPNVPARQFWAVTVYDLEEANFIRESSNIEVNSYQDLQKNADGSVDIYGPEQAVFDKTWKLPDIEEVK